VTARLDSAQVTTEVFLDLLEYTDPSLDGAPIGARTLQTLKSR